MKTTLISSVLLISAAATPAFAQGEDSAGPEKEPMLLTATQMDSVRAGALINVNALNNVGVAVHINAQVAAHSQDVTNTADQTAQTGDQISLVNQF
jgi:hypothetical protein